MAAAALAAAVLLTGALALAGQEGYSEPARRERYMMSLSIGGAFPVGAFMNNLGHIGPSVSLSFAARLGDSPFMATFECSAVLLGLRSHHEYLSGTIPVEVEVTTTNNLLQGLVGIKFQPGTGHARPYLEGLAGFDYFFTETVVSNNEYPWDEIASDTNFDYGTFCAGAGAGVDVMWKGGRLNPDGTRNAAYRLDFKVRYLFGGRAKYLRDDSIVYKKGIPIYLYRESTTNMVSVQVGILVNF
jgi:hypothetical protein